MRLSILGATGSVGASTIDFISGHPGRFEIEAVTANGNVAALAEVARRVGARIAVVADERQRPALKDALAGSGIEAAGGRTALIEAASRPTDCVVGAIVGAAGLEPTLAAVAATRRMALANKECLVTAGPVFMAAIARSGTELLPVDSEHAGVFQCLEGQDRAALRGVTITASGGPFRTWSAAQIAAARPEQALKHPNWTMGRKITIDSATLMNKGLEVIEAHHLFALAPEQLGVVVHPQSIVHALVAYEDGSVLAQLAMPDMRAPIAMALGWPRRLSSPTPALDLARIGSLTFEPPDRGRFPALQLAEDALRRGAGATAALNAANEVAVEAFLSGRTTFPGIARLVEQTLESLEQRQGLSAPSDLAGAIAIDHMARETARALLG